MLPSRSRSLPVSWAVRFHALFGLLDLRLFGLEFAGFLGGQGAALNALVDPLLLILYPFLDPGVVSPGSLDLCESRPRRNTQQHPAMSTTLQNDFIMTS